MSQRALAESLGLATSRVNRLIGELLEAGHLEVVDRSVRPYAYRLTAEGKDYRRRLTYRHFRSVLDSFRRLRIHIAQRLREIKNDGIERLALYGSGEVMEITRPLAEALGLDVVGVVDHDPENQGSQSGGVEVRCPDRLDELDPDGVLITTLSEAREIEERIDPALRNRVQVLEL